MRLLEIATWEVDEKERGKGHASRFLAECERVALFNGIDGVFVENVLEQRHCVWLERLGFQEFPTYESVNGSRLAPFPLCYLKVCRKKD